ncbi:VOC family protein [Erythrobacter sp. THAF29]|uniref:VOC family protein n=1 Tax=Erythrobacter sp. THAF29 TaxID=2587851 RepID=UPI001561E520|nr:VOC family protein [Erythrobacter sp. THAF29]
MSDIDDTLAFYSAVVPYELVDRQRVDAKLVPKEILGKREGEIEIALVWTPTVFLRLIDIDPETKAASNRRPATGPGYTHICFQSPADAPKYGPFKDGGLDMLSRGDGPVDLGGYGVTYAYGFDPDGIMIEMEQVDRPLIEASGYMGQQRLRHEAWITHLANVTAVKPAMVEFYRGILGYGPQREIPPMRRKTFDNVVDIDDVEISASWFDVGNIQLEFWHYSQPETPLRREPRKLDEIGYNGFAFEVTDLDGTIARLRGLGMEFATDPFELAGWRIAFAHDPEGNLLAFQQRDTARPEFSIEDMRWFALTRSPEP